MIYYLKFFRKRPLDEKVEKDKPINDKYLDDLKVLTEYEKQKKGVNDKCEAYFYQYK